MCSTLVACVTSVPEYGCHEENDVDVAHDGGDVSQALLHCQDACVGSAGLGDVTEGHLTISHDAVFVVHAAKISGSEASCTVYVDGHIGLHGAAALSKVPSLSSKKALRILLPSLTQIGFQWHVPLAAMPAGR